jgi:hypothetical protein
MLTFVPQRVLSGAPLQRGVVVVMVRVRVMLVTVVVVVPVSVPVSVVTDVAVVAVSDVVLAVVVFVTGGGVSSQFSHRTGHVDSKTKLKTLSLHDSPARPASRN